MMLNIPALCAGVAQLVEQRIRNAWVAGSTPVSGNLIKHLYTFVAANLRRIAGSNAMAVGRGLRSFLGVESAQLLDDLTPAAGRLN